MNVLFVCKHNRFRSKVAEAVFNKYNEDRKIKIKSRGIKKDIDVAENVKKALKGLGLKLADEKSRKIKNTDVEWADLIVVVADNVKLKAEKKRIFVWKIPDTSQENYRDILAITRQIKRKVLSLLSSLK